MSRTPPPLRDQIGHRMLSHLLGDSRAGAVAWVIFFLVALSLFGNTVWELLPMICTSFCPRPSGDGAACRLVVGVLLFPSLLVFATLSARRYRRRLRPRVREELDPPRVKGLLLFLSVLPLSVVEKLEAALAEGMDMEGFKQRFGACPWRMPVEAVAYHRPRLDRLVVIPSADDGARRGSHRQTRLFGSLLATLFPADTPRCIGAAEVDEAYEGGLDFESDAERLAEAVDACYDHLRAGGLPASELLIDVTGGKKPTSVVGSAVALAEGRRIQYVSTDDYRVRVYDVSYDP